VIAELLVETWGEKPVTQRDIARTERWLGCHPTHEKDVVANEFETTTRRVRSIIRSLRVNHGFPILSNREGYYLPKNSDEADAYLKRMEREAKARAAASIDTYIAMRDTLGITSELFDKMAEFTKTI
jgi:biotin operon repressor